MSVKRDKMKKNKGTIMNVKKKREKLRNGNFLKTRFDRRRL